MEQELAELGIKVKHRSENFVIIGTYFWKRKTELTFLEIMRKHGYALIHKNPDVAASYFFEKCKN